MEGVNLHRGPPRDYMLLGINWNAARMLEPGTSQKHGQWHLQVNKISWCSQPVLLVS
jgi:hypothetical protein